MQSPSKSPKPSWREIANEALNTITHGAGLALTSFAIVLQWGKTHYGCIVYLLSLASVYLFSTLSHGIPGSKRAVLRQLDQGCIFLLIAGTYTPLVLRMSDNATHGYILIAELWLAALIGFISKVKYRVKTIIPYVVLGWCPALCSPWIFTNTSLNAACLIIGGGLAYTAGLYFFLRDERFGFHALWHIFVIAGSALHFAAIYSLA